MEILEKFQKSLKCMKMKGMKYIKPNLSHPSTLNDQTFTIKATQTLTLS